MENQSLKKWQDFYLKAEEAKVEQLWPSENLVRMFKGKYISDLDKKYSGKKVLDVGFGNGNNLFFLNSLGLKLYGTDITQAICDLYTAKLKKLNMASL